MVFYIIEQCYPDINITNIKKNDIEKVKFGIDEDKRIIKQYKSVIERKEQYKKLMSRETEEEISGIEDFFNDFN